ncbi:MAG: ABC-type sugar transport system, permease component [Acidimicrobiales bacterium]|nr:ABC-type sugar transport system, permease component [Acidimicrobiales bacterium]
MTTDQLAPVGTETDVARGLHADIAVGRSSARRTLGLAGQYGVLVVLAFLVLAPILFTIISALSVPTDYVKAGEPLHPVHVAWLDRTWFSGGFVSVVARTLIVLALLAWIQRIGAGSPWREWRALLRPARLVAILGGTVALALLLGPVFGSLHDADGKSQLWIVITMVVVAATQAIGFADKPDRSTLVAAVSGAGFAVAFVGIAVLAVGPSAWTEAWTSGALGPAMQRSLVMAVLITLSQVVTSLLAAYAFVFLRFPFKRILFAAFMATLLLPLEVTLVGNVALIRQLGWINSTQGLVLPFAASALGTFLIRQGFRGIPTEIRDATRLDGYGHVSFLTKFAVPLTRPVVASFTVISALQAWNQYLWPRSIIQDESVNTLQIQLRTLISNNIAKSNLTVAGALVAAVPVAFVLVAFQRQIIRGLTAGAVK